MERRGFADWVLLSPVTWLISAMNIGVFVIMASRTGEGTFTAQTLVEMGALERGRIWAGEIWRLGSAMVIHVGFMHLLWNTYAGFGWDAVAERSVGSWRFAAVYAGSGIGASAVSVLSHDAVSAGASGAGFGIAGLWLVLLYRRAGSLAAFLDDREARQLLVNLAAWTLFGILMGFRMDHFAHGGGFAFGILLGGALLVRRHRGPATAGATLVLALAASAAAYPWPGRTSEWSAGRAHDEAARAIDGGQPEKGLALLAECEKYGFREYSLYYNRALALKQLGRLDEAETEASKAIERNRGEEDPWSLRAGIRALKGDRRGAVEDYRKALENASGGGRARIEKVIGELEAGQEKKP